MEDALSRPLASTEKSSGRWHAPRKAGSSKGGLETGMPEIRWPGQVTLHRLHAKHGLSRVYRQKRGAHRRLHTPRVNRRPGPQRITEGGILRLHDIGRNVGLDLEAVLVNIAHHPHYGGPRLLVVTPAQLDLFTDSALTWKLFARAGLTDDR